MKPTAKKPKKETEPKHDHSRIIHGRSRQTDRYPDGCLVIEWPKLR